MPGESSSSAFRWPPQPLPEETQAAPAVAVPVPGAGREVNAPIGVLESLERLWLGRTARRVVDHVRLDAADASTPVACWRCAGSVGPGESDEKGCAACRGRRLPWQRAFRLGPYDGRLREAVHDLKYHAFRAVGRELGYGLAGRIRAGLAGEELQGRACVVPVPTRLLRRCTRNSGVDHTLTLARAIGRELDLPVVRALARRPGPPQTGLSASARKANVRNMFVSTPTVSRAAGYGTLIVVDDVRTTGATMSACIRALRRSMAEGGAGNAEPGASPRFLAATVAVASERRTRSDDGEGVSVGPNGGYGEN